MSRAAVPLSVALMAVSVLSPKFHRISLADLLLALAVLLCWRGLRRVPLPGPVAWCAAAWVLAGALSASLALVAGLPESPGLVLFTVLRRAEVVLALGLGALAGARAGRRALTASLLLAGGAAGLYGLVQRLLPPESLPGLAGERMLRSFERGVFQGEANHFAALFALSLPVALVMLARPGRPEMRRVAVFGFVLSAAGLFTTGSRTGLLAAGLGCLVAASFCGGRALLGLLAAAAVGAVVMPGAFLRRLMILAQGLSSEAALGGALGDRAVNWSLALQGFRDRPLLGAAPGSRAMGFHDSELLLALEGGGLLGTLALAALVAVVWLGLRGREYAGETGALGAMLVLSVGLVAFHMTRTALPFMLLAGAALGEGMLLDRKQLTDQSLESD